MHLGFNGRFFEQNWRPALQEIEFGRQSGFRAMQFQGKEEGLGAEHLGAEISAVRDALQNAGITAVMEIVVRVEASGKTVSGKTPLEVLQANLSAITGLPCQCVHWHLVALEPKNPDRFAAVEQQLVPQFRLAVELARQHGFQFGFEHNELGLLMFDHPESCARLLGEVPGLSFVWDLNHTSPDYLEAYQALSPRMSMLHVSDTPLPEVNYHFPVGQGNIDFTSYFQVLSQHGFDGPAILEIGGQPKSGGFGRDTDEALIDSLLRLIKAQTPRA